MVLIALTCIWAAAILGVNKVTRLGGFLFCNELPSSAPHKNSRSLSTDGAHSVRGQLVRMGRWPWVSHPLPDRQIALLAVAQTFRVLSCVGSSRRAFLLSPTLIQALSWRFRTVVLEKILESPWDGKEIKPVHPKGTSPEYSLEGLMLQVKLQYFNHLMRRTDLLEKTLMLGKTEGRRRRGWQRMASPTQWTWVWLLACCSPLRCKESDTTERLNWTELMAHGEV